MSRIADPQGKGTTVTDAPHPGMLSDIYLRMRERWQKCRDLMEGTEAIRRGRDTYLPRFESESDESYDARLQLAALFNGYERTVLASVGMLGMQSRRSATTCPNRW